MPPTISSISVFKQNITGAGSWDALAAVSGDSLTVADFADGSRAYVEEVFTGTSANSAEFSFYSTRFGDPVFGLRLQHMFNPTLSANAGTPNLLLPDELDIELYQVDVLSAQAFGTATNNVNATMQVYYENLPGSAQLLASWEQVKGQIVKVLGIEVTVSPGATGQPGTAVAINANDNRWVSDASYAVLGMVTSVPLQCIRLYGPDTGYAKIPVPGSWNSRITSGWFVRAARLRGVPHIPVINSNNAGLTFIDSINVAAAASTKVSLIVAQLRNKFSGQGT
jgi:hypothetical protein